MKNLGNIHVILIVMFPRFFELNDNTENLSNAFH